MMLRSDPPAPLGLASRTLLAFIDHAGEATDDQLVSHLAAPTDAMARVLANMVDAGYVEHAGEQRVGWARRLRPLYRITDQGRRRAAQIERPDQPRRPRRHRP